MYVCMHACLWSEKAHIPVLFLVLFSLQYYWMVLFSLQYFCFAPICHSGLAFVLEWFSLQVAQLVTQLGTKNTTLAFSHVWRHFRGLYFSNLDKHWEEEMGRNPYQSSNHFIVLFCHFFFHFVLFFANCSPMLGLFICMELSSRNYKTCLTKSS